MVAKGFFIVADITGYTAFLTQSELDHAELVLDALFKVQLDHFTDPITVNSFRGDGILAYALEGGFTNGKELLERLNQVYFSFSAMREMMHMNVTCPCNACNNIKGLDLKLFVHHGNFMLQRVGDREEMLGPDVIVVHRMMKNQVKEQTGVQAYVLITEVSAAALDFGELLDEMQPYSDEYEHIGQVRMLVYDLNAAYQKSREEKRIVITSEDALVSLDRKFPISAVKMWEYIVNPEFKKQWCRLTDKENTRVFNSITAEDRQARHNYDMLNAAIVDYRLYELCTIEGVGFDDSKYQATFTLSPTFSGCSVSWHLKLTEGDTESLRDKYQLAAQSSFDNLLAIVEAAQISV